MEPSVFVTAPSGPDGQYVKDTVERAMEEAGYRVIRQKDEVHQEPDRLSVRTAIREADLIIADVSTQNPNVMYELGFAHALRKLTIQLISKKSRTGFPADLAGFEWIFYDPEDFRHATAEIKGETKTLLERRALRRALTF